MSAIGFGDELVRDYLVFRGFLSTLKVFESEIKTDKDRGFRPDRIVEHFSSCIINLDLTTLRESWNHLDQRFFARLEQSFMSTVKKLETALLRMYLVTCISSNRQDKLLEFFEKMASDLQGQPEWKEWFAIPFLKNVDENPTFAVFFSRQWQDTMLLSLHNFLSVVFQSAAMPTILSYEDDLLKIQQLTEENEVLKKNLASALAGEPIDMSYKPSQPSDSHNLMYSPSELMDDFYVIAQESPPETAKSSIKSLIRNISVGLPTSPTLTRRPTEAKRVEDASSASQSSKIKPRSPSVPPPQTSSAPLSVSDSTSAKDLKVDVRSISHEDPVSSKLKPERVESMQRTPLSSSQTSLQSSDTMSGFIILSREKYSEHNSLITHCKFNSSGTTVASSDMDGVIKIWNPVPSISTLSTIMSKTSVLSLEWDRKRERLLFYGGMSGIVRLYDSQERRVIKEITTDSSSANPKVVCICCNPVGSNFVTSTCLEPGGQLSLWDMKTLTLEKHLLPSSSDQSCVTCCSFNHNGQLLLAGLSDGTSCILDLRTSENIATWSSHDGSVLSTEFSTDETQCYTMGNDKKFNFWSVNKTGHKINEIDFNNASAENIVPNTSYGKQFCFNNDGTHFLTCGPLGGIIYKISNLSTTPVLDIGGHTKPVNTVDWSVALESSTCICGTVDGKVIVSTLLNQ